MAGDPLIPFLNLKAINADHRSELLEAIARVVDSGRYVLGEEVRAFEEQFAGYCGVPHAVGVGNGLDALTLIFRAYRELGRMSEGDEVIVPALRTSPRSWWSTSTARSAIATRSKRSRTGTASASTPARISAPSGCSVSTSRSISSPPTRPSRSSSSGVTGTSRCRGSSATSTFRSGATVWGRRAPTSTS